MRTFPDVRMRELLAAVESAMAKGNEGEHAEAAAIAREARSKLGALGGSSAFLDWLEAVALDIQGRTEDAFAPIRRALEVDPVDPQFRSSHGIIIRRLRDGMLEASPRDPCVGRLYALLLKAGEADVSTHLAMVRAHLEQRQFDEAQRLIDAVLLLAPASVDAWMVKAALHRARGDEASAAAAEVEARARCSPSVPFGLPAMTRRARQ